MSVSWCSATEVLMRWLDNLNGSKTGKEPRWNPPVRTRRFWSERATVWAFPCSSTAGPACRCWNGPPCLRLHSWRGRRCTPWLQADKTLRETLRLSASPLCPSLQCYWEKDNYRSWMNIAQRRRYQHQYQWCKYPPQASWSYLFHSSIQQGRLQYRERPVLLFGPCHA